MGETTYLSVNSTISLLKTTYTTSNNFVSKD